MDGNGTVDVDLPRLGADHLQKDLFVEIDSMPGRRLSDGAIAEVVRAFRRAPLPNPGGRQGVALHVDNGPSSIRWRRHLTSGGSPWRAFDAVKRDHFDRARARYFRYAGARSPGSSRPAPSCTSSATRSLRMRRAGRRTVRVTASDDRGLDQILARIGGRTRRTPYAMTGRRRLALTVRAGRVSAIALDRAGRYSAPASRGNSG